AYGAKLLGSGVAGTWSLRAVDLDLPTGDGACPTPAEVGAYKPVTAAASNQRQPAIGPDAIVWQDDRAGAPTLFRHPRAAAPSAADEAACQGALPACPPGPQSEPDVAGTTLVWTQSEGGGSTIYSMDLGSRATQRLAEPGHPSRQDAHPRIAEGGAGLAVWQTRNATAPAEGWDVVLDGLATLHPQTLALPGDQVDPATNGRATVFRDEDTHQLLCRACLPGVTAPLHEGGGQAALDRAVLGGMAWRVDGLPATPDERPAGTFSAEVLRGTLFAADGVPVSDLALHPSGAFLQGAAFLGGLGLLLDEAGDDRFVAGDHAQGSAFALDLTPAAGLPAEEAPSGGTPGAHGILVSSGNDRFFAQLFAQGAVLDVPATAFVPNGGRLPSAETVQASHALGLLLGQHGSNTYDANGAAQGFGALMAGFSQVPGEPDPMNPRAPPPPSGIAVTADGAAGVLADLGGVDVFTNVWVNRTWASLADPCGLVALDGVPGLEALLAQCRAAAAPAAADEPDSLWTQGAVRAGPTAACAGQTPLDPLAQMVLCNQQVAVVGGIGLDLSLLDRSDAVVAKAAGIDLKVKVGFQKEDPGHTPILSGVPVRGPVRFVASVEKTSPVPYEVQSVEFYVNGRFLDYGTPSGDQYVLPVDTATDATPDGTYRVAARVLVRGSTQLPSPGFVEGSSDLVVNNPPRILAPRVAPTSFSPFPTVPGAPALPDVSFGLTKGTPADPDDPDGYVLVQVFGPGGNLVGTLASPADGPAANPFHATWDGLVDGQAADPGLYRIQVQAADRRVQANTALDPDRLAAAPPLLVQVGSVGPTGGCVRVKVGEKDGTPILSGCNPQMAVTRAQATRDGGSPRLVLSLAADPGRDLGGARLFRSPSPAGAWTELELPAGSFGRALDVENGSFRLMVLAQDRDGNLECAPSCGGKVEAATPAEALAQALAAKEALGQFATFVVDLDPPEVLGVVNAKPLSLDGEAQAFSPADVAPRVGPNSVVRVAFAIHKAPTPGMQPPQGLLAWSSGAEGVDPTDGCYHPTVAVDGEPVPGHPGLFSVAWPPAGTADAAVAAWRAIVRAPGCPAWADGPVSLTVGARDEAGNLASNLAPDDASAWLTLVGKAPVVDVAASHVEYPDGRSYAQTGDEVTLVVKMAAPGALAFHESKLCAFLGANPLVPAPPATACGKDGLSCASSPGANVFCYDPQPTRKAFVATVPITVEDGLHAQPFSIPLTIADPVGNLAQFHLDVVVGAPDVGAGEGTALPRVGGADVLFATGRPSTARLHYGQDEKALDQWAEEVPDPAGLVHAFHLEGLTPGATYFYQLVASDSGAQEVSPAHLPLPRFRVLYGVDVQVTDPGDGAILSGSRLVHYHAGVQKPSAGHGDQPFVRITLVPHDTSLAVVDLFDDAPSEKPVKLATASPSSPDGLYDVVAQASYDGETVESRVTGLLLDNTPPTGALVEPAPDAILPAFPRTLLLRVSDAGSGVAPTLGLRVNGSAVPALARFVPDAVGAGGILEATLPLGLSLKGTIPVLATVADRAGTSTQVLARVLVDPEAPAVTSASILYPDGQTAGRPGQGARLLVRLSDGAGIAAASADLRAVGGSIRTQLQEGPLGHFVDFTLPATATDGAFPIPFQATNLAGLTAVGEAVARVDTQPPRLLSSEARPTGMDAAAFSLTASEPVRATVEVLSGASRVLRTPSSGLSETPTLPLTGLQAAHDYVLRVRLVDRAGNVATQDVAWRFAPLEATPAPVTGLAARPAAAGIRLTWDAQLPEAAFRYDVMRSDGGLFRRVASVASATFLDDGVAAGSPYQYFVQAANLHGSLGPASGVAQAVAGLGAVVEPTVSPSVGLAGQTDFLFRAQVRRALEARPLAWLVV
ncbi:MAG: hypothetical protein QOI63_1653, partial [Thermoplasmata archaeon]|nr:hypothetical protein [Thermoplasmata archaeon]